MEDLKTLHDQALQAAGQAKKAVEHNAMMLQQKIAERTKLLSQLEQAKMQEQVGASLRSMSELAAPGNTPSLDEVRDKIERRYANAIGSAELAQNSVQGRMLEVQQASVDMAGQSRLEQIRASMRGEPAGRRGGPTTPATPAANREPRRPKIRSVSSRGRYGSEFRWVDQKLALVAAARPRHRRRLRTWWPTGLCGRRPAGPVAAQAQMGAPAGLLFTVASVFLVLVTVLLASWSTPVWALLIPGLLAAGAAFPATLCSCATAGCGPPRCRAAARAARRLPPWVRPPVRRWPRWVRPSAVVLPARGDGARAGYCRPTRFAN